MKNPYMLLLVVGLVPGGLACGTAPDPTVPKVPLYGVHEISFRGPLFRPLESPAAEVEFYTEWRHESGSTSHRVYGFWDGDGAGGSSGDIFKVRFCPTRTGRWTLVRSASNQPELNGQKEGYSVYGVPSPHPGFWEVDPEAPGRRWFRRSDGSHPYVHGNTHYTFLSEYTDTGPNGSDIVSDISGNVQYFKKVRFSITGDRYPHPEDKPFLDSQGKPTDQGDSSHRPNPGWFHQRVDRAVAAAYEGDLIADLILNGPDTEEARSVLRAGENDGDPTPFLRYMAARYGSYPNVWICLSNEWDIRTPRYTSSEMAAFGQRLREFLPYPTPVSAHPVRDWHPELNADPDWNSHVILQRKLKLMPEATDIIQRNHRLGGGDRPVINDELAYQGEGDGWSEEDVIESHLGAFLGGGYATTSYKPGNKQGQYFWGDFDAEEHSAADNLLWLREKIDSSITFWTMEPVPLESSIFSGYREDFRAMAWEGREYVLGTNQACSTLAAELPPGRWEVRRLDVPEKTEEILSPGASGLFSFEAPESRAVLFCFKKLED